MTDDLKRSIHRLRLVLAQLGNGVPLVCFKPIYFFSLFNVHIESFLMTFCALKSHFCIEELGNDCDFRPPVVHASIPHYMPHDGQLVHHLIENVGPRLDKDSLIIIQPEGRIESMKMLPVFMV